MWLHFHRTAAVSSEFWKAVCPLRCQDVLEESQVWRSHRRPNQPLTLPCSTLPIEGLTKVCCVILPKPLKTNMKWHTANTPSSQHVIMWDLYNDSKRKQIFFLSDEKYAYAAMLIMFAWPWLICFSKYHAKCPLGRVQDTEEFGNCLG